MRSLLCGIVCLTLASCVPAATSDPGQYTETAVGDAWIALLGNYVGKRIQVRVDGALVEDRRFTFPPPGATDRIAVPSGPARTVRVAVEIEGCDNVWSGEVAVVPLAQSSLIFDGCDIRSTGPG